MVYELMILERANEYDELAIKWFDLYCYSGDEVHFDMASNYRAKCEGLLEAYSILSGIEIRPRDIKNELKRF